MDKKIEDLKASNLYPLFLSSFFFIPPISTLQENISF